MRPTLSDREIAELLRPPTEAEAGAALAAFAEAVRASYSGRLRGLYLFGSRARGDHRPDSDADVAVVLDDGDWAEWIERRRLNRLAYDAGFACGLDIQPWPIPVREWTERTTPLARSAHGEATSLGGVS